ncbi:MAG TPA: hypothetical protein VFS40_08540 [Gemmatimonadales bacterium]|nr:hypothetical protein [Gemmatimonadales bacterium]
MPDALPDALHDALARWGDFYVITGTGAAALTGLQFVVQSLLASELRHAAASGDPEGGIGAFSSPTVVHFTLALVVSSAMCVPWPGYPSLRAALVALGAGAFLYSAIVLRRARRQHGYRPVAEDWLFHVLLPAAAYAAVLLAGVLLADGAPAAAGPFFLVGAAALLLLCIGIHNAWDTVTYLTIRELHAGDAGAPPAPRRRVVASSRRRRRR